MKQTLLSRLILAGLAGAAMSAAHAGQIQASSVSIAREVITSDAQAVASPTVSYRFAGDIDPTVQTSVFQVQVSLALTAEWDTTVVPTDDSFTVTDGISGAVVLPARYTIVGKGFSADKKTLWVTISVTGPSAIIKQPIVTFNGATSTTKAVVVKLKTIVGDLLADYASTPVMCTATKSLGVTVQHFVALSTPSAIAVAGSNGVADEHTRSGNTSAGTLIVFPTNLLPTMATATTGAGLAPGGNTQFAYTGGLVAADPAVVGGLSTSSYTGAVGDPIGTVKNLAYLGSVSLKQNATGYDSNLTNTYALGTGGKSVTQSATSTLANGPVEAAKVVVTVAATNGFALGGFLELRAAPAAGGLGVVPTASCSGAAIAGSKVNITAANQASPSIDLTLASQADLDAAFGTTGVAPAQVCYTVPGNVVIPASQFSAVTRIYKSPVGTANTNEQDNICNGQLLSLGGGLKIDVRNYASSKETSGYQSVIRLINNSDLRSADVYGQIIHQSGQYGAYGKLTTLAPRQVLNMTAAQIDALLITAPAATAAADNGASAPVASAVGAPRLRITSQTGSSLRVQNYLFNAATGQILEGSGGQGVDFEGSTLRAPGSDGQYISQDANSGLNGK